MVVTVHLCAFVNVFVHVSKLACIFVRACDYVCVHHLGQV